MTHPTSIDPENQSPILSPPLNLSSMTRRELRDVIARCRTWISQAHRISPAHFRDLIRLDDDEAPITSRLCTWQHHDFQAIDGAWQRLIGFNAEHIPSAAIHPPSGRVEPQRSAGSGRESPTAKPLAATPPTRAWIERPRGHSKTSDIAAMVAWALDAADQPITGIAAASDREQATLLRRAIERLIAANPQRLCDLKVLDTSVRNGVTNSELRIISSDVASSYGELVDFVICDELCHWPKAELWYSLLSTAAKRAHCLLVVLTNAGVGTGWQWLAREAARQSERWHFSTLDGPQAPWITASVLEEQRRMLPEPVFNRLWLNQWQQSDGQFVTLAEAKACEDPTLSRVESGQPGLQYIAAIDYGEKHDYTAAVIAHHDGRRIIIDRLDVAVPNDERAVPVAWVADWIERQSKAFPSLHIWVDEHQLLGLVQHWEKRLPISRFAFSSGAGNHQLAVTFREAILNQTIAWPPGCGAIPTPDGSRNDLTTEVASLKLQHKPDGRLRFNHASNRHDDRAFVVALATLKLAHQPTPDWMTVSNGDWLTD